MKKTILLVTLGLLLVSSYLAAQPKPFIGYDKVAWGASVADVRKAYSIDENIAVVQADPKDPNLVYLIQENISDSISERTFYFNGNKLYRVVIEYKDGSDATKNQLKTILEQRYGTTTSLDVQSGRGPKMTSWGIPVFNVPYNDTINILGKFSPEIEVQLIQRMYSFSSGYEPEIFVYYTWKKFRDEYQASKLGL